MTAATQLDLLDLLVDGGDQDAGTATEQPGRVDYTGNATRKVSRWSCDRCREPLDSPNLVTCPDRLACDRRIERNTR